MKRCMEGDAKLQCVGTNENIKLIHERLKVSRSRQKSYTNVWRKDLQFQVGDKSIFESVTDQRNIEVWSKG